MTPFAVDAYLTTGRVAMAVVREVLLKHGSIAAASRHQALLVRLKGKLAGALAAQLDGQRAAARLTRSGLMTSPDTVRRCRRSSCALSPPGMAQSWAIWASLSDWGATTRTRARVDGAH